MRTIALATFARSEANSALPLVRALRDAQGIDFQFIVANAHLARQFGETINDLRAEGVRIDAELEMLLASDSASAVAKTVALGTIGLADIFARRRPDLFVLIGDRIELLGAATTATAFNIPIAHISGGELTEGAVDNQIRFAVSRLASLHFVGMQEFADRLVQSGEEPWRVHVTGDPALDLIRTMDDAALDFDLQPPVIVLTYHPTTISDRTPADEIEEVLAAVAGLDATFIVTAPNADAGNHAITAALEAFVHKQKRARLFASLGARRYYTLLRRADLMIGNSSSGIWEAPTFQLPVVNIGDRQRGRTRTANVLDVAVERDAIRASVLQALSPGFKESLKSIVNPYGDGHAAPRIVDVLRNVPLGRELLMKRYTAS